METGRNVMHYALGDNQDYEHEWSKAVLEYLENGYSSEDGKSEVEVGNTTYKILKREKVTAFYDADGNTLFDIENDRLKEEYEAMDFSASEPQSEMGKVISNIEQQAFEQAVNDDIDADDTVPMGTASLIRLPNRLEELKKEGEALHHCVGTYMERVRKGETMIFFIRRKEEPEKPYYTLEWHGKVVQCRGSHNCDMTPEVKAFVQIFQEKMTEYASEPQKHRKAG